MQPTNHFGPSVRAGDHFVYVDRRLVTLADRYLYFVPPTIMDAKESERVLQSFRLGPFVVNVVEHRHRWRKHRHVTVGVDMGGDSSEPAIVMCAEHAREMSNVLTQAAAAADS